MWLLTDANISIVTASHTIFWHSSLSHDDVQNDENICWSVFTALVTGVRKYLFG